jgi:hypothetical protein
MDSLWDLGRFPLRVCLGAVGNVLLTVAATYVLRGRRAGAGGAATWLCAVLGANLLPVFALRSRMDEGTVYPVIEEMDFFSDQHKFSRWVYAAASANMAFWVLLSWRVFSRRRTGGTLAAVLLLALAGTSFPAWARLLRSRS